MEDILEPSCVPLREAQPVHDIRRLAIGGLISVPELFMTERSAPQQIGGATL